MQPSKFSRAATAVVAAGLFSLIVPSYFPVVAAEPVSPAWDRFPNPTEQENTSYVSRAAPTPVCDAAGVYVSNEGGVLAALDFTGNVRWQRDLVAEFSRISARHGLAASPEQDAEHIFVWIERSEQP